jgi:hypothetical protein
MLGGGDQEQEYQPEVGEYQPEVGVYHPTGGGVIDRGSTSQRWAATRAVAHGVAPTRSRVAPSRTLETEVCEAGRRVYFLCLPLSNTREERVRTLPPSPSPSL